MALGPIMDTKFSGHSGDIVIHPNTQSCLFSYGQLSPRSHPVSRSVYLKMTENDESFVCIWVVTGFTNHEKIECTLCPTVVMSYTSD